MNQPANSRVLVEIADGIAQVRLNRPDKLNALDRSMIEALLEAGRQLQAEKGLRAVILGGVGRAFCAGLDLVEMAALAESEPDALAKLTERDHGDANAFQQVALQWRDLPVPVIAAVHGVCYGGGLQIASGADIRIVAPDARLSIMETSWGIVPDMGGFVLWSRLLRDDVLRELVFTARDVSGEEAVGLGLATRADPDPVAAANRVASEIALRSPDAIRAAKQLANRAGDGMRGREMLEAESRAQAGLIGSANPREAVAARMAGRTARFSDE